MGLDELVPHIILQLKKLIQSAQPSISKILEGA